VMIDPFISSDGQIIALNLQQSLYFLCRGSSGGQHVEINKRRRKTRTQTTRPATRTKRKNGLIQRGAQKLRHT
ncbi:Hypothetical predicted protein, partial [Scomber scombrus]